MGAYSKSISQDLRTVVEDVEKLSSPESVFAEPLGVGVKAGEFISGIETVMPYGIKAGGSVTVSENITPQVINTVVESILSSSERQLTEQAKEQSESLKSLADKYTGSILDIAESADIWTGALIDSILTSTEKQTESVLEQAKQAVGDITETTKQLSYERVAETEEKGKLEAGVKNTLLLIGGFLILFFIVRAK